MFLLLKILFLELGISIFKALLTAPKGGLQRLFHFKA